jgi:hypothetical protein
MMQADLAYISRHTSANPPGSVVLNQSFKPLAASLLWQNKLEVSKVIPGKASSSKALAEMFHVRLCQPLKGLFSRLIVQSVNMIVSQRRS